jgi:hypothetical protein
VKGHDSQERKLFLFIKCANPAFGKEAFPISGAVAGAKSRNHRKSITLKDLLAAWDCREELLM